jgi:hypothetical protein
LQLNATGYRWRQLVHFVSYEAFFQPATAEVTLEKTEPGAVAEAFELMGVLYQVEEQIRKKDFDREDTLAWRAQWGKPAVDAFFVWCEQQCQRIDLVPSNPLSKALKYARTREHALRLYLADPDLRIDTNHLGRALRVIPIGRKSSLFLLDRARCRASRDHPKPDDHLPAP